MKSRTKRIIAFFFLINILFEVVSPTVALALTGGPSQPEVEAFTPISTSDMVNVGTGDFNYNIPLFEVDGYPVNLAYDAGISNDAEASWVGLGWNINPGTVNRTMRGLPDDFDGDEIHKETNMKPNQTFGASLGAGFELFGVEKKKAASTSTLSLGLNFSLGLNYNTYNGYGMDMGANVALSSSKGNKKSTGSLGVNSGSGKGLGITADYSYSKKTERTKDNVTKTRTTTRGLGTGFNTVQGLTDISVKSSVSTTKKTKDDKGNWGNEKTIGSQNGGASLGFANTTYMPSSENEMVNVGLALSISWGTEVVGTHVKWTAGGYYSGQFIRDNTKDYKAYGYLNSQRANDGNATDILHDFNREKDGQFTLNTPGLPVTNYSYDVFSYSGQGIGGNFRPHRNDVGTVFDPMVKNFPDVNTNIGIEIGAGNIVHGGLNVAVMLSRTKTGKWMKNGWSELNNSEDYTKYKDGGYGFDEVVYFKQAGEKTVENNQSYVDNVINSFEPVRFDLQEAGTDAVCTNDLITKYGAKKTLNSNTKSNRKARNESLTILTAAQCPSFAVQPDLKSYLPNSIDMFYSPTSTNTTSINRIGAGRKSHHISEISTLRADGARYVYSLPIYNNVEKNVSFAVEKPDVTSSNIDYLNGQVDYSPGSDNSLNNSKALDHFFHSEEMPAYAHSYLLSAVLSADYIDRTQNGPSTDDYGNYTKINYSRIHTDYEWRMPYAANQANYNEGIRSYYGPKGDDKASYTYGKKEIWNMHSIETKNHVAVFVTSDRLNDGRGVIDENGGMDANLKVKQLDEIRIYTRQEFIDKGANAIPQKVVHFQYDNSLCKGIENNINYNPTSNAPNSGKLTLKKVWFTYESSFKGKLSPYEFFYGDNNHITGDGDEANFDYNSKSYDRWGNYKPNMVPPFYLPNNPANTPLNSEFPYTQQEADVNGKTADDYAAAWNLTKIKLPSGGEMNITYEADDYAFVQDRKAMQMFKVAGSSDPTDVNNTIVDQLYDMNPLYTGYNCLHVPVSADFVTKHNSLPSQIEKDKFIRDKLFRDQNGYDMKYVYFRFLVNVERDLSSYNPKYEYLAGYAEINYSATPELIGSNVKFTLKQVPVFDNISLPGQLNPISMTGINYVRKNMPKVAHDNNQDPTTAGSFLAIFNGLKSAFTPFVQAFKGGQSNALKLSKASSRYLPERSFVRLYSPTQFKKGGGHRVKQLTLNDSWLTLTANANNKNINYGQEYFYETKDNNGNKISSGVAAYEPLIGGDENPFRRPVFYEEKHVLAPDDDYYHEEPYGESFFPSPSVNYSRVVVRNLTREKSGGYKVSRHGTGAVVHEFYTAKDFPTLVDKTDLKKVRHKPNPVIKILKFFVKDYMTTSQGYQVVLNDMHGKPKGQKVYKEADPLTTTTSALEEYYGEGYISAVEYKYKQTNGRLDNKVSVINKAGTVSDAMLGVDYDMVVDTRESRTVTRNITINGNLEGFLLAIFPALVPTIFPGYNQEKVRYRSSVVTKVIFQSGLLQETIARENGASVSTINKMWDGETGEVLLTQTTNNFSDKVYSLNYPAHWAYHKMGGAYKNIGASSAISGGNVSQPQIFVEGDEVLLAGSGTKKVWVNKITPTVQFIDETGAIVNIGAYSIATVLRSGCRNQQNLPAASATSLVDPLVGNNLLLNASTKIIDANAMEYKEDWGVFCNCSLTATSTPNHYLTGQKGNWRLLTSYAYLTGREQSLQSNNTNIRKDGPFKTFSPFWTPNNVSAPFNWLKSNDPAWQYTTKSTIYHPNGVEVENKDALGRNSSALYGYNNTMPIAVGSNAEYRQVGFDGFEDYDYNDPCDNSHFSYITHFNGSNPITYDKASQNFISQPGSQNQKFAHTGRKAIKLSGGASASWTMTIPSSTSSCNSPSIIVIPN